MSISPVSPPASRRRRHRLRRILLRLVVVLAALALLVAGAAWFLLATEAGARWLFTRVGAAMAGSLEVEDLDGPIRGPLAVQGLLYETEGFEIRVDRLTLEWRLRELLRKRLDIVDLTAEGVHVLVAEGEERGEEPSPLPDIHLPINIIVRQARVRDMDVRTPGAAEPLLIDSIDLRTRGAGDTVEIEQLAVRSPQLTADIAGRVMPQGDYGVDLTASWTLSLPDQPRWAAAGSALGNLKELRLVQQVSEPVVVLVDATLKEPMRDLAFDAVVEAEPFGLRTFGADLPQATVGGRVHAVGQVEKFEAMADVTADTADYGPAHADLTLTRDGELWRIDQLVLDTPAAPTRVEVAGEVRLPPSGEDAEAPAGATGDVRFDVQASWTDLVWPLNGEPAVRSSQGRLAADGTAAAYGFALNAVVQTAALPPTPVEASGNGGMEGLTLESSQLQLLGGTVKARGDLAWTPRVEWRLAVEGRDIDPGTMWPEGDGNLAIDARTTGHLEDAGAFGRIAPLSVKGTLRGEPIAADGAVELAGERIAVDDLAVDWGSLRLTADGRVAPTFDFTFDLAAPSLGVAVPDAGGSLTASGRLSGPQTTPRIEVTAAGEGLIWGEMTASVLNAEADLDLAPGGDLELDVEATRAGLGERSFERVAVSGSGRREGHTLEATVEASEGSLRLAATGELDAQTTWSGELTTLDVELPDAGSWTLVRPAPLTASATAAELGRLCAVSGSSELCVDGAWRGEDGWQVAAELTALPLSLASSFLPPELDVEGTVGGEVAARAGVDGAITADADLQLAPGQVVYPVPSGERETLRFGAGTLTGRADTGGVTASLELPLPDLGSTAAEITLPGYRLGGVPGDDQPLAGALRTEIRDLSFLQAFAPQLDATAGRLDADLRLAGTVGAPRIRGEARLADGAASLPQLGIRLEELQLSAVDQGGDSLRLEGSVRSGEGTLTLTGEAPAIFGAERPVRLEVTGRRFQAMDTPDFELLVSPDLDLTYDGERLAVTGEVRVPEAEIELEETPTGAVEVSQDVVYVGGEEPSAAADSGLPLALRVRVILGDDVEIDVLGLKAEPTGSLLLIEEPGEPTTGTGQIDLAGGTFKAYGQDLTIERGRLIFGGPIANPRVDLRAYRRAKDGVIAGLEATGPLSAPEITLWSEPPMDQSNQLSYILLGRPIGQASESEGNLVANAAVSLGIKGGNLLAERLAAQFGLEEARIETDDGLEEASLVLGKYLSPRLYVAYGVGLFEAVNTLRLRYLLSSKWTLEATTGVGTGADLLYTIERGRGAKREVPPDPEPLAPRKVPAEEGAGR